MSPEGMLRFEVFPNQTIRDIMDLTAKECKLSTSSFSLTTAPRAAASPSSSTLSSLKIQHGDMFYCVLRPSDSTLLDEPPPKDFIPITADVDPATNPNMVLRDEDCGTDSSGEVSTAAKVGCTHPKTMKCFRCTPKERYVLRKIKCGNHGPNASCTTCVGYADSIVPIIRSQDKKKCRKFFMYPEAQRFYGEFATMYAPMYQMIGLIYGHELYDKTVVGEFIFEPPQIHVDKGVSFDNSPQAARQCEVANTLLNIFGLKCIGWIVSHFKRTYMNENKKDKTEKEDEHSLTANELLMAGKLQAQFGHRFCTMNMPIPHIIPGENWERTIGQRASEIMIWGHQTSLQFQRLLRRGTISAVQNNEDRYLVQTTEPVRYSVQTGYDGAVLNFDSSTTSFPVEYCLVQIPFTAVPLDSKPPPFRYRFLPLRPAIDLAEREREAKDIISKKGEPFLDLMNDPNLLLYLINERGADAELVYDIARAIVAQKEEDAAAAGGGGKGGKSSQKRDTSGFELIVRGIMKMDF